MAEAAAAVVRARWSGREHRGSRAGLMQAGFLLDRTPKYSKETTSVNSRRKRSRRIKGIRGMVRRMRVTSSSSALKRAVKSQGSLKRSRRRPSINGR